MLHWTGIPLRSIPAAVSVSVRSRGGRCKVQTIFYKGYEIHAAPYQVADTSEWTVNIHIFHDRGGEMRSRQFSAGNCFKTRKEAVAHCFNFGRQIIDGKSKNCTVDEL